MLIPLFHRRGNEVPEEKNGRKEGGERGRGRMSLFDVPLARKSISSCNSNRSNCIISINGEILEGDTDIYLVSKIMNFYMIP